MPMRKARFPQIFVFTLQMLEESRPRSKAQGSGHLAFGLGALVRVGSEVSPEAAQAGHVSRV